MLDHFAAAFWVLAIWNHQASWWTESRWRVYIPSYSQQRICWVSISGAGDWWHENARPEKTRGLAGTFRCWVAKLGKWTITHLVWWVSLFSHLCFFTKWLSKMLSYEWISHYNPIYFPTKRWSSIIPFNYPFSKDPLDNPIIMSLSSRQTIKTSS